MSVGTKRSTISAIVVLYLILSFSFLATACQEGSSSSNEQPAAGLTEQAFERPTLRWEAPTTREDGSRLYAGDIKAYRIYYRLRHQDTFKSISRPGDGDTSFTLSQFKPGAYEFTVTAIDSEGRESRRADGVDVDLI